MAKIDNPLRLDLAVLAVALGLIFLAAALGHCSEIHPMRPHNLESAQEVLGVLGHQVKPFDGAVAFPRPGDKEAGNFVAAMRGQTLAGDWYLFVLAVRGFQVREVKAYPICQPKMIRENE